MFLVSTQLHFEELFRCCSGSSVLSCVVLRTHTISSFTDLSEDLSPWIDAPEVALLAAATSPYARGEVAKQRREEVG